MHKGERGVAAGWLKVTWSLRQVGAPGKPREGGDIMEVWWERPRLAPWGEGEGTATQPCLVPQSCGGPRGPQSCHHWAKMPGPLYPSVDGSLSTGRPGKGLTLAEVDPERRPDSTASKQDTSPFRGVGAAPWVACPVRSFGGNS